MNAHPLAPGRLPAEPTRLVGRDRELAEVRLLLGQTRLLTLAGPGGCGKTRLALSAARSVADGAYWIELASLEDPELVPQRVAQALGVPESPGRSITPSIVDHLLRWPSLLVLDNCEHLVAACATIADHLLRAVPGVRLLATSREPLGVAGEVSWPVPPLGLPDPETPAAPADLARSPAVELFVERARAARPAFAPTVRDIEAIARLCRRLDGIPLAIELAAARVRVLSPTDLLDRLGADLGILADRGRTAVPRHRTLLATMDWSYDLLSPDERRLFRRLSAFVGGFSLAAAEAVGDGPPSRVLDLLSGLVEKSLVLVDHSDPGDTRYRLLETVRDYATTLVRSAGEVSGVRAAHAGYVEALARQAEAGLLGPAQREWVSRLTRDQANIATALAWLHQERNAARGLDLAGRLGRFWWFAGQFAEGATWLETFLAVPANRSATKAGAGAPTFLAVPANHSAMKAGAGAPTFLAVPGAPARGAHRARALHALGLATFWHESPFAGAEASRACFEEAVDIYRELGDDRALAAALRDLGGYWKGAGDAVVARMVLGESVAIAERIGDDCAVAAGLAYLGVVAAYTGAAVEARDLLERALAVLRERGGTDEVLRCAFFLACLDCDAGETATARARFQELLSADVLTAMPYSVGFALDGLARLAAAESQPHRALRLTGAARAAHERVATSAGPAYDAYVRRGIEPVRTMLSPAAAQRAVERGRAMTLHEAMAEGLGPVPQTSTALTPHEPLSAREAEVLHLAAEGLADADIAGRLHLSRRTVGNHLSSTYRKLGVGTRTAAIREARELGLL